MTKNQKFFMAGTEGTGEYLVYVITAIARLGVRSLRSGSYRIRVEPLDGADISAVSAMLTPALGWKQPGHNGQNRWSEVVALEMLRASIALVLKAIQADAASDWNPEAPEWARSLMVDEVEADSVAELAKLRRVDLVAMAKQRGLKVLSRHRKSDIVALIQEAQ